MLANVAWGHTAGEQLLSQLDFASVSCRFSAAFLAELACEIEAGAGPFDGELALHLSQAGHDVEEEAS